MKKFLGKLVKVVIDRPILSKHPNNNIIYELNYGFVPNTMSPDGEEIDAYVVGVSKPISEVEGKVIAIIKRKNDIEDKLVVKPLSLERNFSREEIANLTNFQEKYFDIEIII